MKHLRYWFRLEFQYWDHQWRNSEGRKRLTVSATDDILRKEYVDYSILERFFIFKETQEYDRAKLLFSTIKLNLTKDKVEYCGFEYGVGIEFKPDFCKIVDTMGTDHGIDAPLYWNITTPIHLQYIPTSEILQLFDDWLEFLKEVESNPPRFSSP
jgi:hypothetical protein